MSLLSRRTHRDSLRPMPTDPWEAQRVEEQALRRRMLEGTWDDDLERYIILHMGRDRRRLMGPKDMTSNFIRSMSAQLASVLFDKRPTVTHDEGTFPGFIGQDITVDGQTQRIPGLLERAGLWALMPRVHQGTVAINEMLMQVQAVVGSDGVARPMFRPIYPDMTEATEHPEHPGDAIKFSELRERTDPRPELNGRKVWAWDEYDISDPSNPRFRVVAVNHAGTKTEPLTEAIAAASNSPLVGRSDSDGYLSGEDYPWFYLTGDALPFIPIAWFHRRWPITLWDPFAQSEATHMTLSIGLLWSYYLHVAKTAAHQTKYIGGGRIDTGDVRTEGEGGVLRALGDATAVVRVVQDDNSNSLNIGSWGPGIDLQSFGKSNMAYEARGAQAMGVDSGDIVRTSGDPQSGYSIAINDAAKKKAAERQAPVMKHGVQELLSITAGVINSAKGEALLPESGWEVSFPGVGQAPGKEASQAFNGAQVTSAVDIIGQVARKEIPRESGIAALSKFFNLEASEAESIIATAGAGFVPAATKE